MFADNTYSKPYFVTYVNTSFFAISLIPYAIRAIHKEGLPQIRRNAYQLWHNIRNVYHDRSHSDKPADDIAGIDQSTSSSARLLVDDERFEGVQAQSSVSDAQLTFQETAVLSLEFCLLWFTANYFVAACLSYTSVASSTILTSTSSIWTLIFGSLVGVERFSIKKLIGVTASFIGIILISSIDLASDNDENRGNFPHKTQREIAIGDAMAFFSAVMYGIYTVVMKKRIDNEDRVNMPLFFGMVGLFNVIFLWPGFLMLHWTRIETFELPPNPKIWIIVLASPSNISKLFSSY